MVHRSFAVLTIAAVALWALSPIASGDTILGVYAGAGSWQQSFGGEIADGGDAFDVGDDLGVSRERNDFFYVALEHPLPVLPNLRASHVAIEVRADEALTGSIDFAGTSFSSGTDVRTDLDLTQDDFTLYYEVLDNLVSLDIGVSLRYVDGYVEIASTTRLGRADFRGALPLVYGKARFDLPFTGAWIGAEVHGLTFDGNDLIDANAQVGWQSPVGVGIEAGWRTFRFDLEEFDDFDEAAIAISGPYAALNLHF